MANKEKEKIELKEEVIVEEKKPAPAPKKFPITKYVNCSALNVRKSPMGQILRVVESGEALRVVGEDGDWYKLEDGSYVMKEFLK